MRLFYLSDLHLRSENEKNSQRLITFLKTIPAEGDLLVLGGDIFDLFIGNKAAFKKKFKHILGSIRDCSDRGCTVYYLEGNHDFHLNEVFSIKSGVLVKTEDFYLDFDGKKIWVSHGDMIDEEDRGYRLLRATTRHPLVREFIRVVPGRFIDRIGNWSSKQSRKYNNLSAAGERRLERTRNLFSDYAKEKIKQGFEYVLIGHSHMAQDLEFKGSDFTGQYINLGFSQDELIYGELDGEHKGMIVKVIS